MKYFFWMIVLVLFCAGGCGKALIPKPDQSGEIDLHSRIISKKMGGAKVSVQTHEWQFNPSELEQYFTPFLFLVRNESESKIPVSLNSIYLVDTGGNQLKPLQPSEVEKTMTDRGYVMTPTAHLGIGMGGYHSMFGMGFTFPLNSARPLGSDIASLALPEGDILPGATVRGFVYFQRTPPAGDSLKLHIEMNQTAEDYYFLLKR
ncbi:MAG: hypothetical protein HYR80_06095 [Nitrospirae bacterium]|nr:hypothetical protein [Nitrospirota bacterium]